MNHCLGILAALMLYWDGECNEGSCTYDRYWISYTWTEAEAVAKGVQGPPERDYFERIKIRFDWVASQGEPWWTEQSGVSKLDAGDGLHSSASANLANGSGSGSAQNFCESVMSNDSPNPGPRKLPGESILSSPEPLSTSDTFCGTTTL
jgi:hypothetical protein